MVISSPGLASQRKLEQRPFFAGSLAFSSGHQYSARRTQRDVVLPSKVSPYRDAAMEYNRVPWGTSLPFELILVPCKHNCHWLVKLNRNGLGRKARHMSWQPGRAVWVIFLNRLVMKQARSAHHQRRCPSPYRRDDSIGLALPVGDLSPCLDDDVAGLSGGLRTHYPLH